MKSLRARFALWVLEGDGGYALAFALLLLLHALLIRPLLPHTVWHEFHGADIVAWAQGLSGGLSGLHGPGFGWMMRGLRALSLDRVGVFDLNYAVSLLSAALFFAAMRTAAGSAAAGWAGGVLLLLLPIRMRLSTTESVFVWVEALSVAGGVFAVFLVKDGRRRWLWALLAAAALLVYSRAEMLALVPAVLLFYGAALRKELPRGFFRSPGTWAAAVAASALVLPRAYALLSLHDPRTAGLLPRGGMCFFLERGLPGLDIVFDLSWTPALFIALSLAGALFLAVRRRALMGAIASHFVLAVLLYAPHLSCLAVRGRTALATQYLCAGLAAWGFWSIVRRLGRGGRAAACAALLGAAGWGAWCRRGVLSEIFVKQREYSLLQEAGRLLPDGAGVVFLGTGDAPDAGWGRDYQGQVLSRAAAGLGKRVVPMTADQAVAIIEDAGVRGLFFFRGLGCCATPVGPGPVVSGARPFFSRAGGGIHPACEAMVRAGEALLEERSRLRAHGPEDCGSDGALLGLYRLTKGPEPAPGGDVPAAAWLRLAEKARDAGAARWVKAALLRAASASSDSAVLAPAALLLQEAGELAPALRLFDRLVKEHPRRAAYWSDRGVLKAMMGDVPGARADLRKALELNPSWDPARRSLEAL